MRVFFSPRQLAHAPVQFLMGGRIVEHPDVPRRAEQLLAALQGASYVIAEPRGDYGIAPIARIHAPGYLMFLRTAWQRWQALEGTGPEMLPNVYPYHGAQDDLAPRQPPRTASPIALAGHYLGDLACPIGPHTFEAAVASAHAALAAADAVLEGERAAYALCRPPGHHAGIDRAAGFCYLNNVAIAAEHMRSRFKRAAILDIDGQHGDGTQAIFYRRSDVQFVSIHADPASHYPFFSGYADEYGAGDGEGCNLNLPLAAGSGDAEFLDALDEGLAAIRAHASKVLLVSVGLDAHAREPFAALKITHDGYRRIGDAIAGLKLPTVFVQEGGYGLDILGANLTNLLGGYSLASRF
jgi:acetoin utilization deacetylase AcuC-like enzyme